MCGILGKINAEIDKEFIEKVIEYQINLSHRGEDSYGLVAYQQEKRKLFAAKAMDLVDLIEILKEKTGETYDWIVIHNRKASVGEINLDNAHPVVLKDEGRTILVIQNGTKKSLRVDKDRSDTHGIAVKWMRNELKEKDLDGAGVVFIFDTLKGFYFHKDNSRTLVLHENEEWFASEPVFPGTWYPIKEVGLTEWNGSFETDNETPLKVEKIRIERCIYCGNEGVLVKENTCTKCAMDWEEEDLFGYKYNYNTYGYYDVVPVTWDI